MPLLQKVQINGQKYSIHYFTGTVADEKKWSETSVSGSGGGGSGYSVGGTGVTNSNFVDIRSTTTQHEQIILQDKNGKDQAFKFVDWDIACRQGNVLTVAWAIPEGKDSGPYIIVYNHDSDEIYRNSELARMMMPGRITLPVVGHTSWWGFAAIPATPIAWSVIGSILPIGALYGVLLIASPFLGFWLVGKLAKSKGEQAATEYLRSDPDKLLGSLKATRQDASTVS